MSDSFVAVDVETANPRMSSICQIGLVAFKAGTVVDRWSTLVDPRQKFSEFNVAIHGIDENEIAGAPTFREVLPTIRERLRTALTVSYSNFDRTSFSRACSEHGEEPIETAWLDVLYVARRTWPEWSKQSYRLAAVAPRLSIAYSNPHNAECDAEVAGRVFIEACRTSGVGIPEWLARSRAPRKRSSISTAGNPDGVLFGESIVFTGALAMVRADAAKLAADAGCSVSDAVTKKTTILVVGDQDLSQVGAGGKSSKHRKAEAMLAEGASLRIIGESDFLALISR